MIQRIQEVKNIFDDFKIDGRIIPIYVDERVVSKVTGIAVQTLRNDRFKGVGIPYSKISRSVRYRLSDVVEYMDRHRVETKQEQEQQQN